MSARIAGVTLQALRAGRTLRTDLPLDALRTLWADFTLDALRTLRTFNTLDRSNPLRFSTGKPSSYRNLVRT